MKSRIVIASGLMSLSALASPKDDSAAAPQPATAKTLGRTVVDLDQRATSIQEQLRALGQRARTLRAFTVARGRSYVRLARAGLLPLGGGFGALVDHAARLERLRKALERDLAEGAAIESERQRLARTLNEIEARREIFEGERAALERSHAAIAAAEERQAAFERAFRSSFRPSHTAVYSGGAADLDSDDLAEGFSGRKGRLPFPLSGRAEIREARRAGSGPGLEMAAPLGSVVQAIYPGRVAFADDYPSFGRTVIVDHGDGYFSVTAGFDELVVEPGIEVRAGQSLGRVGRGGSVYLEIREGQRTVAPGPWFGL